MTDPFVLVMLAVAAVFIAVVAVFVVAIRRGWSGGPRRSGRDWEPPGELGSNVRDIDVGD